MIGRDPGARAAVDAARWLARLAGAAGDDLGEALGEIAERVLEVFPVDLVVVQLVDETGADVATHGHRVGPSGPAQALAPLLAGPGPDPVALGDAAIATGAPVAWPRLSSEPEQIARLAAVADAGGPAGAAHRLLLHAGGIAVPIGTAGEPVIGAVTLVSLSRDQPVPDDAAAELAALAPQIALAARNHQLAARTRRFRQTLEGVIASSRMGMLVSDARGRLSITNRAASDMLGMDLGLLVGQPTRSLVAERIKWRFTNPEDYASRLLAAHDHPGREALLEVETVDGRAVEHTSAPVRDVDGRIVGRVDILTDVTTARGALSEARRLAAERAELLAREERRAQEEREIATAAHLMASALTPAEIHEHLLDAAHAVVQGCEKSAVLTVDARGLITPAVTRGFDPATLPRMTFRSGEGTVGRLMVEGRPFICNDTLVDDRVSSRITSIEGIRSFMLVPLVRGGRVLGLVSLNCMAPREFGEREVRVLTELARHAAAALANALEFEQERHIAATLQQSLIADDLPAIPGVELAALYEAAAGSLVGGDFYSAWPLADGRLALLVGDVSGKGVEAAGVTAMVRYMAEALSHHQPEPAALVGELNGLVCPRLPDGALVTLLLVVIDTAAGTLRWCSAGHPPAVLIDPEGGYRTIEDPDPPCGVFPEQRFHEGEEPFGPGDTLVAYTDGLIEARRKDREFGESGLRDALMRAPRRDPDGLARAAHAAARAWSGGRLTDDVAVAVVRRTPA
ncbi:MAG: SpoIIE family protein phosphatase [Thermoleophilia bacterium]